MFCEIHIKGHLSDQWADWFDKLQIENRPDGEAVLSGALPDQAALYGILNQMRDLGIILISLNCTELGSDQEAVRPLGKSPDAPSGGSHA